MLFRSALAISTSVSLKNSETKQDVVQKCSEFYSETEVEIAKAYLWNKCKNYYSEKLLKRKAPDELVKNVVDIVDFVCNLNWNQCPVRFAAIDATRVPSMVCKTVNINVCVFFAVFLWRSLVFLMPV